MVTITIILMIGGFLVHLFFKNKRHVSNSSNNFSSNNNIINHPAEVPKSRPSTQGQRGPV
jgi:hypothetical protein